LKFQILIDVERVENGNTGENKNDALSTKEIVSSSHRLMGGISEAEQMAKRIENRLENRVKVTFDVRKDFLQTCRSIAVEKGYDYSRITLNDLREFRDRIKSKVEQEHEAVSVIRNLLELCEFRNHDDNLLQVLDRAIQRVEERNDRWCHYQDFNFYETVVESTWPWMRSELRVAALILFLFYFCTPIWFCHIVPDDGICVTEDGLPYAGWMSSLYFASTTLSTVGYGDLSVTKTDGDGRIFIGAAYMILALIVAVAAFSAAAEQAFSPLANYQDKLFCAFYDRILGKQKEDELLYKRIGRVRLVKMSQIFLQFVLLVMIGVCVSQAFPGNEEDDGSEWSWMTSFYWSIQTTTTIGYGDLDMSFEMRWFQIFYLTVSTYFVGDCFGKLGSLKEEILEIRRQYAWGRRKCTKALINDMQADVHDEKVDQYEFLVGSLLSLGKLTSDDVAPIMAKFRELSGNGGFITYQDIDEGDKLEDDHIESSYLGET